MSALTVLETILAQTQSGRSVALCAIVATRGSTPQPSGIVVCVDEATEMTGTLGGGCVEADVRRQAHQQLRQSHGKLVTFSLDSDFGYDDGMICGGHMDVAISVIPPSSDLSAYRAALENLRGGRPATLPMHVETDGGPVVYRVHVEAQPELVIAGGGHLSRALVRLARPLGFRISVIDDRADYANVDRFPPPVRPVVGDIAKTLSEWSIDASTYIVLVTRGHKHDEQALRAVLDSPARYIGMIGSRRKIKVIFDDLQRDGGDEERLARVHAPIGLDIQAVTADEIAVSIAAELISVRRAERRRLVEGPLPVSP